MNRFWRGLVAAITLGVGLLAGSAAFAATVVTVTLWDKGSSTPMGTDMAMSVPIGVLEPLSHSVTVTTVAANAAEPASNPTPSVIAATRPLQKRFMV